MKNIRLIALAIGIAWLSSCAGLRVESEYGTLTTDAKGNLVITPIPKPIIIPTK